jgi:glycosyltransferase involved in cell wall biosynthesis
VKVLFVCNSEDDGGAARSVRLLVQEIDRALVEPVVVVHREGPLAEQLRSSARVYVVPELVETPTRPRAQHFAFARNCADLLRAVHRLREIAAAERAELLYGHTTWSNLVAAWAAPGRTVWHIRNDHSPAAVRAAMLTVARATAVAAVIAVSHAAAAPYAPLRGRLHVIPNGVDLAIAQAARAAPRLRREHHIGSDSLLVGAAGRLVAHKGLAVLARAAAMLREVRFAILGGNPRHEGGDALAELRKTMPPDTIFTGWLAEPEPYVADLDVLVVPSLYPDPFPRTVIEAMALGVPVVASDIGGIPEAVRDGREGFLVPPGDAQALAARIALLASQPALRREMAERALSRAEARYSARGTAQAVAQVLRARRTASESSRCAPPPPQ